MFTVLFRQQLKIYLTIECTNLYTYQILQKAIKMEEYLPYIEYILGEKYIAADNLS